METNFEPHLVLLDSEEEFVDFLIPMGKTTIGRDDVNDISLADTSISRNHCYLVREGDEVRVFDADSRNLTRVGKKKVDGQVLKDGEILRLGRCHLLFKSINSQISSQEIRNIEEDLEATQSAKIIPETFEDEKEDVSDLETNALFSPTDPHIRPPVDDEYEAQQSSFPSLASSRLSNRRSQSLKKSSVIALIIFLLTASTFGGIFLGDYVLNKNGKGALFNRSYSQDASTYSINSKLEQIQLTLLRQEEMLRTIKADIDANRRLNKSLPAHIQKEIELFQRLQENKNEMQLNEIHRLNQAANKSSKSEDDSEKNRVVTLQDLGLDEVDLPWDENPDDPAANPSEVVSSKGTTKTEVVNKPDEKVKLSRNDLRDLVKELKSIVGEYADPSLTAQDFEPYLGTLLSGFGEDSARSLFEVQDYAYDLLSQIDKNVAFLDQRTKKLLHEAKKEVGNGSQEKSSSSGKYGGNNLQRFEEKQRLLELSKKKIEILKTNSDRLRVLRRALLDGFLAFTDPEATRFLANQFSRQDDLDFRLAVLKTFEKAKATNVVAKISSKLVTRDTTLKEAIHKTLVAIVGEDLGQTTGPWKTWYEDNVQAQS